MESPPDREQDAHDDQRATDPPAETEPEAGEGGEDAGPMGNPDVDEEALSQRQQQRQRGSE
jgi:hypothetical protein